MRPGSTENGAHLWHDPVQPRDPLWKNKLHGGALRYAQSLQIAASAGNTLGASNYATMQLFGNLSFAIPRNVGAARSTFAKLAAQGHPVSQQMIGFMVGLKPQTTTPPAHRHCARTDTAGPPRPRHPIKNGVKRTTTLTPPVSLSLSRARALSLSRCGGRLLWGSAADVRAAHDVIAI